MAGTSSRVTIEWTRLNLRSILYSYFIAFSKSLYESIFIANFDGTTMQRTRVKSSFVAPASYRPPPLTAKMLCYSCYSMIHRAAPHSAILAQDPSM